MSAIAYVPITGGKVAVVDAADLELVSRYTWRIGRAGAALSRRRENGKDVGVLMHRLILNAPHGMMVDHKDHNPLNNTRANLRLATNSQNQANKQAVLSSSGFKGVNYSQRAKKWQAGIKCGGKTYHLGFFTSPEAAAGAYAEAAKRMFGEFACPSRRPT